MFFASKICVSNSIHFFALSNSWIKKERGSYESGEMGKVGEKVRAFATNRWLVFVAAMWLQSMAGIGYLFGAISPVVKAALGYNQRQVAALGVAKDLGDCVGFLAGTLSATLPAWAMLLVGAAQNFLGYGWLWLIVTRQLPALPLSMVLLCNGQWIGCSWI